MHSVIPRCIHSILKLHAHRVHMHGWTDRQPDRQMDTIVYTSFILYKHHIHKQHKYSIYDMINTQYTYIIYPQSTCGDTDEQTAEQTAHWTGSQIDGWMVKFSSIYILGMHSKYI